MVLIGHRSYRINSKRLRQVRMDVGMTQTGLGKAAGYTSRLIRKAETNGHLSGSAIEDLVQTLNEYGGEIKISDVLMDEVAICKVFMSCFIEHGREMLFHCGDLLAESFIFTFAGSAENPLAGVYQGRVAFKQWLDSFFDLMGRDPNHKPSPTFYQHDQTVIVSYVEKGIVNGLVSPPIWINAHFEVRGGLIQSLVDQYDTETGLVFIKSVMQNKASMLTPI